MKKILITGVNGFIGGYSAEYFSNKYEIYGLDIATKPAKNYIQGEVDLNNLKKFNTKFDYIFHFAGSSTVSSAQKSPEIEYAKSVLSAKHLLDYCIKYNNEAKIIFSSSAGVYGDKYNKPISENDELNPISIYGKHKVEAENMFEEYNQKYGIKANIIRFFSIYGEGLKKQLLWDFSNRLKNTKNDTVDCFGTGREKRDFIHINDAVNFIDILLHSNIDFGIFNCSAGRETQINEILKLLLEEYNTQKELKYDNKTREDDPIYLCADISKAKKLGFKPKIDIKQGIKQYAQWFKNN